jgi:hypothetical protein
VVRGGVSGWVRHCAKNLKVAGLIPDVVIGIFRWQNLSGRLSLYQKWVLGILPGGKGGRCLGVINLPPSCADCLEIWAPHSPGNWTVCPGPYRDTFIFTFINTIGTLLLLSRSMFFWLFSLAIRYAVKSLKPNILLFQSLLTARDSCKQRESQCTFMSVLWPLKYSPEISRIRNRKFLLKIYQYI